VANTFTNAYVSSVTFASTNSNNSVIISHILNVTTNTTISLTAQLNGTGTSTTMNGKLNVVKVG